MSDFQYRFNFRDWLMVLPIRQRKKAFQKILDLSGQSKSTLNRIMYLKNGDDTYVKIETKRAICQVLEKELDALENSFGDHDKKLVA